MKIRTLIFLAILPFVAFLSCKKDDDPNMAKFKINKEAEKIEASTTGAVISGTYEYPGKVNSINVRVGISDQLFGSDVHKAEINGKAYSVRLTGLQPGTVYYYRYEVDYGSNDEFLTDIYSFTTLAETPVVKTLEVLSVDSTNFRVKCEVVTGGGYEVTERGICWNNYGDPTIDDMTLQYTSAGIGEYTIRMENLALCKKYYVRAYAKSEKGVGYGEELEFETPSVPGMPVDIYLVCNPIEGGTVTGDGVHTVGSQCTVIATANPSYTFINWTENGTQVSTDATYTFNVRLERHLVANFSDHGQGPDPGPGPGTDNYTISVSASPSNGGTVTGGGSYANGQPCTLVATANPTFAFARWTKDGTEMSTSSTYTFTVTESATYVAEFVGVPAVEISVVNRTKTSISTKTKLSNFQAGSVTERGICYGQSPELTYYSHETIPYSGQDNEFYIDITGLTPGDRYYMRSYAKVNGEFNYSPVIDTLTVYPWYYVTDIPGQSRTQSFSFAIGSKAYIGTGVYQNYMYLEDMWEYDTETGVWTQKANYPEGKVRGPIALTLNNKAYVGLGYRENGTNDGEKMDTFYEYDPISNSWTRKHDYPGWSGRYDSRDAVAMNGKGYFFTDIYEPFSANTSGINLYEYDPNSDRWTFINSLVYGGYWYNDHITAEALGSDLYVFLKNHDGNWGSNGVAFYQYNMEYNTWVEKPCSIPLIYTKMESFVMEDCFYLFSGNFYAGVHNNAVYKYNPTSETWVENAISEPKIFRYNPVNLMINGKLYYGGGDDGGNQKSLWAYDPALE